MPRYLIHRALGNITEDALEVAAEESRRVRAERFPEIEWEHSHVVRTDDGLTQPACDVRVRGGSIEVKLASNAAE